MRGRERWLRECREHVEILDDPWTGRSRCESLNWFLEQSRLRLGRVSERSGKRHYDGGKKHPGDKRWSEIYVSIQSEAVSAVLFGIGPDFDLLLKGDPGYDFITPSGLIDIKVTIHRSGRMIIYERPLLASIQKSSPKELRLVHAAMGKRGEISLTGWVSGNDAIRLAEHDRVNGDPVLWVQQSKLNPMSHEVIL